MLSKYKNFIGVWGNVDNDDVRKVVSGKEIIEINGYNIGIFHGHGERRTTMNRILMLNPGSPTSKRKERWFSYIILELEEDMIRAQLNFYF